jgi:hypothetical protein
VTNIVPDSRLLVLLLLLLLLQYEWWRFQQFRGRCQPHAQGHGQGLGAVVSDKSST